MISNSAKFVNHNDAKRANVPLDFIMPFMFLGDHRRGYSDRDKLSNSRTKGIRMCHQTEHMYDDG